MSEVTVIGAGIVGVMCALNLQEEGLEVTIVDYSLPGEGCSKGNAGVLGAGTCIPVSMPGTLKQIPKWIFDKNGPLKIELFYFFLMLPWLWEFIKSGRKERVLDIANALDALHSPTVKEYTEWCNKAGCSELVKQNGYLHVYESESSFSSTKFSNEIRDKHGIEFERVVGSKIYDIECDFSDIYTHALFIKNDGYTPNPSRLVKKLAKLFEKRGGKFIYQKVINIEYKDEKPKALLFNGGKHYFEKLVVSAGIGSKYILKMLIEKTFLVSERGYHVTINEPNVNISRPIFSVDRKFLATPMEDGLRLAGTAEYASIDRPPNYNRAKALLIQGKRMFPKLNTREYVEWMGHRPATPDSLPVICKSEKYDSIIYAFGHGHTGMAGAPMTGKIVADLVLNKEPQIDIYPYRLNRC
jgi:D-amino-acid dehydrogenase